MTPVDITIYLPDDIGQRAKDKGINFSRLLRDALVGEFAEEDAKAKTLESAEDVVLDLTDGDGRKYRGRMRATALVDDQKGRTFYLKEDGAVMVYDPSQDMDRDQLYEVESPALDLKDQLPRVDYFAVMDAIGEIPEIIDL